MTEQERPMEPAPDTLEAPAETTANDAVEPAPEPEEAGGERYPELVELGEEIERRIRSNQRFLERFLDEDFEEEDLDDEDEDGDDLTEEL